MDVDSQEDRFTASVNGRDILSCSRDVRIVTDQAGNVAKLSASHASSRSLRFRWRLFTSVSRCNQIKSGGSTPQDRCSPVLHRLTTHIKTSRADVDPPLLLRGRHGRTAAAWLLASLRSHLLSRFTDDGRPCDGLCARPTRSTDRHVFGRQCDNRRCEFATGYRPR